MDAAERRDARRLGLAVLLSALGMGVHTVIEFGLAGLWSLGTGTIPFVALQAVLLVAWLRAPSARRGMAAALLVTGLLQLVGAILTVLPLPILPFTPEQTPMHYLAHALYALGQLPLLVIAWTLRRKELP